MSTEAFQEELGRVNLNDNCRNTSLEENGDIGKNEMISFKDLSLAREICFIAVITLAQLFTQAALGQIVAPLHIVGESFGITNPGELSWFAASYSLTVGTFILPSGRWGDLFGPRKLFITGYIWFGIWSLVAGFSVWSNALLFHFARAFQGIGPALMLPNALALLARMYPSGPRKNMMFSIFAAAAPSGFVFGAVFSSIFAKLVWWPWSFWVNGIILLVVGLFSIMIIPKSCDSELLPFNSLAQLDLIGSVVGVTGLVLFNLAWNQGPVVGWITTYTYVILIIAVIFLIAFFIIEEKFAEHPLVPLRAISKHTVFVFACIACGWSSFGIWVFYLFQYNEIAAGRSILLSVAYVSPCAISGAMAAIITGILLSKWRPSYFLFISMVAFCLGNVIMATVPIDQIYWRQMFFSVIIMPFGMDMSFPSSTIILSESMSREHQGIAASLINTVVNYSVSIGLGIAGTVETNINKSGTEILKGYRSAYYTAVGLAGCGIVVSILFIAMSHWWESQEQKNKVTNKDEKLS
ncbi:major facilitator superfamily-domain-containing protein [Lipomyces japonicus]|uniref:major facilitator superfamily-domain-containing protein n=1 Tax=Lipomyces japonicus TaxID=56871 RepID=UPI0034CE73BA